MVQNSVTVDLGLTGGDWQMEDTEGVAGTAGSGGLTDVDWSVALICIMLRVVVIAVSFWLTSGLSLRSTVTKTFIRDTSEM